MQPSLSSVRIPRKEPPRSPWREPKWHWARSGVPLHLLVAQSHWILPSQGGNSQRYQARKSVDSPKVSGIVVNLNWAFFIGATSWKFAISALPGSWISLEHSCQIMWPQDGIEHQSSFLATIMARKSTSGLLDASWERSQTEMLCSQESLRSISFSAFRRSSANWLLISRNSSTRILAS